MIDQIKNYIAEVEKFNASTQEEIENFRIKFLGKKGVLNEFFAEFKNVPNESKKEFGQTINQLKNAAQGKLLTRLAGIIALGILNRILGGLFGIVKFAFILSVVIMFLEGINSNIGFLKEEHVETSIFYKPVKSIAPMILPPLLEEYNRKKVQ